MKRRTALAVLTSACWTTAHSQDAQAIPTLLRSGACVVLLRHAETDPGIGEQCNQALGVDAATPLNSPSASTRFCLR